MQEWGDPELIRASLENPPAFEVLFDRHYDYVRRYAQRRIGLDVGEDVAAETFTVAFSNRQRFDPTYGSARPWLIGIATNLIRHHARSERVRWHALTRIPIDRPEVEMDPDRLDAQMARGILAAALQEVPEAERETFLLHVLGELTYAETAVLQGIPSGTVRSRIHRVRGRLREHLSHFEATTGGTAESDEGDDE